MSLVTPVKSLLISCVANEDPGNDALAHDNSINSAPPLSLYAEAPRNPFRSSRCKTFY